MKYIQISILAFFGLFLASCENDINVNAPYSETSVLYGVLDAGKDTHYVRITRAFLGPQGLVGGVGVGDSLYYDSVQVLLRGIDANGAIVSEVTGTKASNMAMDTGFFATDGYVPYRFVTTLDQTLDYRLVAIFPDGRRMRANTELVYGFTITEPRFPTFNPAGPRGQEIAWEQAVNGRSYRAFVRLSYVEFPRNNKADSTVNYFTYALPYVTGDNLDGIGTISSTLNLDQFYGSIAAQLDAPTGNRVRIPRRIYIEIQCAGDDLATHINVSQPQSGILQDPPFFSNVEGGVGIFSSNGVEEKNDYRRLSALSLDELVYGSYTCHLRFGKVTTQDTLFCQP